MKLPPLLLLHICAGIVGVLSGLAALFLRKGSRLHRATGNTFFISMLTMSASGAYMAAFWKPVAINVIAGVLTFYLVATAGLTIRRKEGTIGRVEICLLLCASVVAAASLLLGWEAVNGATSLDDDAPIAMYFVFGFVALLSAAGDVSVLIRRGVSGAQRVARHLWRMCLSLLLATTSLFLGTPSQLLVPKVIRETPLSYVPALLVVVLMIFWLGRVLLTKAYKKPLTQVTAI
jgi:uncharacterized membrane protein